MDEQDERNEGAATIEEEGQTRELNLVAAQGNDPVLMPSSPVIFPFYFLYFVACCYASTWSVLKIIPVHLSSHAQMPIYNMSCTGQGDIAHFLQQRADLNFRLLN